MRNHAPRSCAGYERGVTKGSGSSFRAPVVSKPLGPEPTRRLCKRCGVVLYQVIFAGCLCGLCYDGIKLR